jgi:hypothetical protein
MQSFISQKGAARRNGISLITARQLLISHAYRAAVCAKHRDARQQGISIGHCHASGAGPRSAYARTRAFPARNRDILSESRMRDMHLSSLMSGNRKQTRATAPFSTLLKTLSMCGCLRFRAVASVRFGMTLTPVVLTIPVPTSSPPL